MSEDTETRPVTLAHRLEFAFVWLLARILRLLGLERSSRLMGRTWRLVAPLTARHKRAQAHLRMAIPQITDSEVRSITRRMWTHLGRVTGESFFLDRLAREPDRIHFDDATIAMIPEWKSGGSVIVSLHMGNWEMLGICARRLEVDLAGLYQRLSNPLVDDFLRQMREPTYPAGLSSKGHSAVRRLVAHARGGGALGVLADLRDVRGVTVPFFGHLAYATPFPAMVARGYDMPLFAFRMRRTEGVNFTAEMVRVEVPRTEDRKADIRAATANLHAVYEKWIRETPEQWMWAHRKWLRPGDMKLPRGA